MASRSVPRLVLASAVALLFLYVLFLRSQGPPSPAVRAPGHLEKNPVNIVMDDNVLKGHTVMPKLRNETAKYDSISIP
jgi:FAD-linked sulfhydryl oxidase